MGLTEEVIAPASACEDLDEEPTAEFRSVDVREEPIELDGVDVKELELNGVDVLDLSASEDRDWDSRGGVAKSLPSGIEDGMGVSFTLMLDLFPVVSKATVSGGKFLFAMTRGELFCSVGFIPGGPNGRGLSGGKSLNGEGGGIGGSLSGGISRGGRLPGGLLEGGSVPGGLLEGGRLPGGPPPEDPPPEGPPLGRPPPWGPPPGGKFGLWLLLGGGEGPSSWGIGPFDSPPEPELPSGLDPFLDDLLLVYWFNP